MFSITSTDGVASADEGSAFFWSQKRQKNKADQTGASITSISKPNGISVDGNPAVECGDSPSHESGRVENMTACNDEVCIGVAADLRGSTLPHNAITATFPQPKAASSTTALSPQNSMVFQRKELAKTSADRNTDNEIGLPPDAQDVHIQHLEGDVAAKDEHIKALELEVHARNILIQELKTSTHKQDLHIKELVAVADEKDRRTAALESEVEEKSWLIQQLEATVKTLESEDEAVHSFDVSAGKDPSSRYSKAMMRSMIAFACG
jgi:hypothetical protein